MKSTTLLTMLILSGVCSAQAKPNGDCPFPDVGFAMVPGQKVQIAEVSTRAAVELEDCGSQKGCTASPVAQGTPVLLYRQQGEWTCGYFSARDGAGPAWIRTGALRLVAYDAHAPLSAWLGTWTGGEDRVVIRAGSAPGVLHLAGNAKWHGSGDDARSGAAQGEAAPAGNHLHFVQSGPNSCTIELTLLSRYILASDNGLCGELNARFQGIWKRSGP